MSSASPTPAEPPPGDPSPSVGKPSPPAASAGGLLPWIRSAGVMLARVLRPAKTALRLIASALIGGLVMLIIAVIVFLNSRPDLEVWHKTKLKEEFTLDSEVSDFAGYLELEDRLFDELDRKIYALTPAGNADSINRYHRGSPADPMQQPRNWNRSFELPPTAEDGSPKSGVLLLHGMSDSPYSLLRLGKALQQQGAHVLGLRLPGHGTAPSGLLSFKWEDMDAAVRLAMAHLRQTVGEEAPLHIIGYSNGGALAVHYTLESLDDDALPAPRGIVLISPAIGVTPLASVAVWQGRLGRLLGLEKLAWNGIGLEYDPFKHVSFSVNAGHQVYRLTEEIRKHFNDLAGSEKLKDFPPLIAFQSAVDATVSAPALVQVLFARLPGEEHELVLFDVDRTDTIDSLMSRDPTAELDEVLRNSGHEFGISLLTNRDSKSPEVEVRTWRKGEYSGSATATDMAWPADVFSLSHVALPFPAGDPLYGNLPPTTESGDPVLRVGNLALRGERGVLQIPPADQLRLRWNPFFPYLEKRVLDFTAGAAH